MQLVFDGLPESEVAFESESSIFRSRVGVAISDRLGGSVGDWGGITREGSSVRPGNGSRGGGRERNRGGSADSGRV